MKLARPLAAALLALALAAPAAARASPGLRPLWLKRSTYGESFTFIADLEDGTYVQLALGFTNLGPGSTKGLCRALVVTPGAAAWNASTRVGRDRYGWDGGDVEKLRVGPCSAWIDAAATGAEVALDGGAVRLVFAARPGYAGEVSVVNVGGGHYDSSVLLYRVPVTATLTLGRGPPRALAGGGYADHSRTTIAPGALASRWVRFRALRGERPLLLLGREGQDGGFSPVWACDEGCRGYSRFAVAREGAKRAPVFRVDVQGSREPVEIRSGALLYRDAPIEDLGVLGAIVRPFTGNPVTYVYRARASENGGPAVDGILEVELGE